MNEKDELEQYGPNYIGKVIRIIDNKKLIINVGKDSITVGDEIQIYTPSDIIMDLDGTPLGIYENVKSTLQVIQTSDFYSVCSDIHEEQYSVFEIPSFTKTKIVHRSLQVDEDDIEPLIKKSDTGYIKVGDLVKKG